MTVEIYTNTLTLIQKALPYLRQGLMERVLQKSEKFQNNILKIITGIENEKISEVILQDWSQYIDEKSSNGGGYYFGTHYYYEPEKKICGSNSMKHPQIWNFVRYVVCLVTTRNMAKKLVSLLVIPVENRSIIDLVQ